MPPPWNVLWIMSDQHRADCLGAMGNSAIQTPQLDRLAEEGVLFEQAFCQSPVCMASRASLLTGRYPATVRVRGMGILPPWETTFAEVLRRNGWDTAAFGKLHLTPELYTVRQLGSDVPVLDWRRYAEDARLHAILDDPLKENYGFARHVGCDDACQGHFQTWLRQQAPELASAKPQRFSEEGPPDLQVSPYPSQFHQTTYIASLAEAFIRERNDAGPWFAFCSFVAPHHPFEAPADQIARYDAADIPLPEPKGGADLPHAPPELVEAMGEMDRFSADIQRRIVLHYYASISLIDDGVGRLLRALEDTAQRTNTLVVFVSDHGEFLGNHGLLRKPSFHYDETLRVPLVLSFPGGPRGRRVPDLVELVDLHPTLLGLLGLELNPGVQGMDWSAGLRGDDPIGREAIYSDMFDLTPQAFGERHGPYCACLTVRTDSWKLNLYPTAHPECGQLFDLRNDPDESRNRIHDPACRDIREQMTRRLVRRMHAHADPLPLRLTQW